MTKARIFASLLFAVAALTATAQPTATSATQPIVSTDLDSAELRERFNSVLQNYPPEVGVVLKLDPSLFGSKDYLANYPALASFVAEHPQITHSPHYYLDRVNLRAQQPPDPTSVRIIDRLTNELIPFAVFLVVAGIVVWLIRTVVEHRRWIRGVNMQTDMVSRLFARFGSNEELLAYLQSGAGQRIFESTALPLEANRGITAPLQRIFWTVQVGIVAAMAGLGLQIVSWRVPVEVGTPLSAMAIIVLSIGVGFILSAIVSHILSRRLGLWTPAATAHD
jgi:hypothetical protein